MTRLIPARWRKPAAIGASGALWAAAWLIHGGPTRWFAIVGLINLGVLSVSIYRDGGRDTDEGALAGSRADERQQLLSLRSRALTGNCAVLASFTGLIIAIAVGASWWWPFAAMLAITLFAYLLGLSNYGADDATGADDNAVAADRMPASW